ncbi:MAG: Maltose/maltodextrin ABC transporter, substrate binding periplasmic protein MalE [Nitrospira sp.]|nr:MAG: Maltose/maltodextrin ABC transporter, substrate binding periplasmic protein MalE [Nitrospira sp.]
MRWISPTQRIQRPPQSYAGTVFRWIGLLILILLPCSTGIACAESPPGAAPATSKPHVTLRFVSWKPDHARVWEEVLADFTRTHPHISVVRELAPHSSTAYHDLLTQKLKNRDATVDVFFIDVIWVPEFAAAGWARPLDDLFSPAMRQEFLPAAIEVGQYDTHVYGVPSRIDAGLLYYRQDLLAKYGFIAPATWPELVRQAETILAGERQTNPLLQGYSAQFKQYEGLVCNMLEFVEGHGGSLMRPDGTGSALSSPDALAAVQFVRDEVIGRLTSRAALTYQEPEALSLFLQGHAIFHRNWPYAWELANNRTRSTIAGQVGVAPLPGFSPGRAAAALGGWLYGISAYSQHPDEAWALIEFLSSQAVQKKFSREAGIAPSREALFSDPEVLARSPQLRNQGAILHAATPRPRSPVYPAISHLLQRYFSRALAVNGLDLAQEAAITDAHIDRLLALTKAAR